MGKLNFAQALQQLKIDDYEEAQIMITHIGPYRVKCLQFGVVVAPIIFQQFMIFSRTRRYNPWLCCCVNCRTEFLDQLHEIIQRVKADGLCLKKENLL